jgi:hypothetical protein
MYVTEKRLVELRTAREPREVIQNFFEDNSSHAESIPLDQFCSMGGAPDPNETPEISVISIECDEIQCTGTLTAYFDEVIYGSGCPDMPTNKARTADVAFKVWLEDGMIDYL